MKTRIADATDAQLKTFADKLGVAYAVNIGRETLEKRVRDAAGGDEFEIDAPEQNLDPAAKSAQATKHQQVAAQGADWVWVNINTSEKDGGDQPVDLYCNGKLIWVPRAKWCRIRQGYAESLKNAVEQKYEQFKDPETGLNKIDPTPRNTPRYPHQVWTGAGEPPKEDQYVPPETTGNAAASRPHAA